MEHNWDIRSTENFGALFKTIIGNLKTIIGPGLIVQQFMKKNVNKLKIWTQRHSLLANMGFVIVFF